MTLGASDIRNYTVKDAAYPVKGSLLTIDTSTGLVDLTAATEVCFLVALDESSRDADQTLVASGATVSAIPVGGVCMVAANGGETWTPGDIIFVGANGQATSTAGSNKKLGIYIDGVTANVTTVEGDLYPVNTLSAEQA